MYLTLCHSAGWDKFNYISLLVTLLGVTPPYYINIFHTNNALFHTLLLHNFSMDNVNNKEESCNYLDWVVEDIEDQNIDWIVEDTKKSKSSPNWLHTFYEALQRGIKLQQLRRRRLRGSTYARHHGCCKPKRSQQKATQHIWFKCVASRRGGAWAIKPQPDASCFWKKIALRNDGYDIDLNSVSYLCFFDGPEYDKWDEKQKQFLLGNEENLYDWPFQISLLTTI